MPSKEELEQAVLVITADDACGYEIQKTFGIVYGVGAESGRVALNKAAMAFDKALDVLRDMAYRRGANAVIAVRQSGFGASGGGVMGDAGVIVLSGTAVILGPRPSPSV